MDVAARPALPRRNGPTAALLGMAVLVASEATLFAAMIGTYYYLRFETAVWPPRGVPEPKWVVPVILVAVLVCSSVPMELGSRAAQQGRLAAARSFFLVALVLQAGYFAYEVHDFADQLRETPIDRNAYTSVYYTLLGADHAHVFVGILFVVWLLGKLAFGLTPYRVNAARVITWYWHFVNLLTIVVLATLLSARA
ncbi:MAG TPA: cytochrome c oxidase subunit 3 [Gaiellaceae bacterium]|jgi:heme/copper-type cytochrome/quinol oxidase subunit 3